MDNARAPGQNYRRHLRRRREFRERQGQRIQRRYHYGRVPDALLMVVLVVVGFVVVGYVASKGLSFVGSFLSFLGQAL